MTGSVNTEEKLLQKRKFYLRFIVIFTVLLLLGFNAGSWFFLNRVNYFLEQELEKRLTSIANLAIQLIDPEYVTDIISSPQAGLGRNMVQSVFRGLLYEQECQNIVDLIKKIKAPHHPVIILVANKADLKEQRVCGRCCAEF